MRNIIKLLLPELRGNIPLGMALSALLGYGVLNFEEVTHTGFFYIDDFGTKYYFSSFFSTPSFIKQVPLLLLYLIQFGMYSFLSVSLFKRIVDSKPKKGNILSGILIILILAFIFIKFTITTNTKEQAAAYNIAINHFDIKILILISLGIFVSGCIGVLLFFQLRLLNNGIKEIQIFRKNKISYFNTRKDINGLIFMFGVIISLATLGTAAIQKIAGDEVFRKEAVYYYGILGSLLMCIIYLPLFFKYKELGYSLIEEFMNEKDLKRDSIECIEFYKRMENDLNLNVSVKDNILEAIPILAPLIAAFTNAF